MLIEPDINCQLCPRLATYREENRALYPEWYNGPVKSIGELNNELLILGLAPGLKGANRTGKPFMGDHAGKLLYPTLIKFGFAVGTSAGSSEGEVELRNCRIANAVRCVPPQNKPKGSEISACADFLRQELNYMPNLKVILALGTIAHNSALGVFQLRRSNWKFAHNSYHDLGKGPILIDSYHCSRYNTNTGRLTEDMFSAVFRTIRELIPIEGCQ